MASAACDEGYDSETLEFRADAMMEGSCDWTLEDEEALAAPICTVECSFGDLGDEPSCTAIVDASALDGTLSEREVAFNPNGACFDELEDDATLLYTTGATIEILPREDAIGYDNSGTYVCNNSQWSMLGSDEPGEPNEP